MEDEEQLNRFLGENWRLHLWYALSLGLLMGFVGRVGGQGRFYIIDDGYLTFNDGFELGVFVWVFILTFVFFWVKNKLQRG